MKPNIAELIGLPNYKYLLAFYVFSRKEDFVNDSFDVYRRIRLQVKQPLSAKQIQFIRSTGFENPGNPIQELLLGKEALRIYCNIGRAVIYTNNGAIKMDLWRE